MHRLLMYSKRVMRERGGGECHILMNMLYLFFFFHYILRGSIDIEEKAHIFFFLSLF